MFVELSSKHRYVTHSAMFSAGRERLVANVRIKKKCLYLPYMKIYLLFNFVKNLENIDEWTLKLYVYVRGIIIILKKNSESLILFSTI